jgi:hypothetical protein
LFTKQRGGGHAYKFHINLRRWRRTLPRMKLFDAQVQLDFVIEETLHFDFRVPGRTPAQKVPLWVGEGAFFLSRHLPSP